MVTATGVLNGPSIPEIDGAGSFSGEMTHTAEWRSDVDLHGKRVVVLGAGCTAVRVVADIADQVESLDVVARQPHWVIPRRPRPETVHSPEQTPERPYTRPSVNTKQRAAALTSRKGPTRTSPKESR